MLLQGSQASRGAKPRKRARTEAWLAEASLRGVSRMIRLVLAKVLPWQVTVPAFESALACRLIAAVGSVERAHHVPIALVDRPSDG